MPFSLGTLAQTAIKARTAYGQGQRLGQQDAEEQQALQAARARQIAQDQQEALLNAARIKNYNSQADTRVSPLTVLGAKTQAAGALEDKRIQGRVTVKGTTPGRAPGSGRTQGPKAGSPAAMTAGLLHSAQQAQARLKLSEGADWHNAIDPTVSSVIEHAGRTPLVGGAIEALAGPTAQGARSSGRQTYRGDEGTFVHAYASALPGRRLGPQLLQILDTNFFPPAGTTDPGVVATYSRRRDEALQNLADAESGKSVDLESAVDGIQNVPASDAAPLASPAMSPSGQPRRPSARSNAALDGYLARVRQP